jgi:DNA-binding NarL/FixJ family response regulator
MTANKGTTKNNKITIVLVESQQILRTGIRLVLEKYPVFKIVGEAGNSEQALEIIKTKQPDLLICGIDLPNIDGFVLINHTKSISPATRSVILSTRDDDKYLFESILAGAYGYLLNSITGDELGRALIKIQAGEIVFPTEPANICVLWKTLWAPKRKDRLLSSREMEILALAASGLKNKDISGKLGLSVRTVEKHFEFILDKLSAGSRSQAIYKAFYQPGYYRLTNKKKVVSAENLVQTLNIHSDPAFEGLS